MRGCAGGAGRVHPAGAASGGGDPDLEAHAVLPRGRHQLRPVRPPLQPALSWRRYSMQAVPGLHAACSSSLDAKSLRLLVHDVLILMSRKTCNFEHLCAMLCAGAPCRSGRRPSNVHALHHPGFGVIFALCCALCGMYERLRAAIYAGTSTLSSTSRRSRTCRS